MDFSTTATLITVLSGALPGTSSTLTFSKKSRRCMRSLERRNLAELKASPSTRRNSRRMTSPAVRTLPAMSMRSTNTRGPSLTSKVTSMLSTLRSRLMRGRTSKKA